MKTYLVTIPIAGHFTAKVKASNEEDTIAQAYALDIEGGGETSWEYLGSFGEGNVCNCPLPWEITVDDLFNGELG